MSLFLKKYLNPTALILREGEGEGGGGGGGSEGGSDASTSPDRFSEIDKRLDSLHKAIGTVVNSQRADSAKQTIAKREQEINQAVTAAESEVMDAEKSIAAAYDEGDGSQIAKAQRTLSEAIAKRENAKYDKRDFDRAKADAEKRSGGAAGGGAPQGGNLDTSNLQSWKNRHSDWYGIDKDMTKTAHEIDGQIRSAGVIPVGSKEYFEAIDKRMKQRFPDRLTGSPSNEGRGSGGAAPRQGGTRIAASVADGYRRMGINIDDPKVAERMLKNRDTAVRKGFLPETPNTARII